MRLFVVAGEASGDLHGANLLRAIKAINPQCEFEGFGGERMAAEGMTVLRGLDHLAFMGFVEVVRNLGTVMRNFSIAKQAMKERRPDALLLIDYPGFNLRLAKWAKRRGIPVIYYIAPQVWAWKESRVKAMKVNIDRLLVILPFEQEYFAKHGMEAHFVGHPLLDERRIQPSEPSERKVIALLPGSRAQEVKRMLPALLTIRDRFPEYRFLIGKAPSLDVDLYRDLIRSSDAELFAEGTQALLAMSDAALVTSGTATLETALAGVPQLVCYRGNAFSVLLARRLIKVPYIALVNLILDKEAVRELIQDDLEPDNLAAELSQLLQQRQQAVDIQREVIGKLGGAGASARAAEILVGFLASR
jgi:lipid-A-disaccharide synthase